MIGRRSAVIFLLFVAVSACSRGTDLRAHGAGTLDAANAATTWESGNRIQLNWEDDPRTKFSAVWRYLIAGPGDVQVESIQRHDGREASSSFEVRGGSLLLVKKFDAAAGAVWDQLQYGTLMLSLERFHFSCGRDIHNERNS